MKFGDLKFKIDIKCGGNPDHRHRKQK